VPPAPAEDQAGGSWRAPPAAACPSGHASAHRPRPTTPWSKHHRERRFARLKLTIQLGVNKSIPLLALNPRFHLMRCRSGKRGRSWEERRARQMPEKWVYPIKIRLKGHPGLLSLCTSSWSPCPGFNIAGSQAAREQNSFLDSTTRGGERGLTPREARARCTSWAPAWPGW